MASSSFREAQQRLAARRLERDAAERLRHKERLQSYNTGALPFPLNRIGHASLEAWENVGGDNAVRPAFRVGQVDAELLDEELLQMLRGQVGDALKYYGSHLKDDWGSEITLILRAILFKLSIWDHNSTYGASLQNLHFVDARRSDLTPSAPSKWQKGLYGLITVGGTYAWGKWEDWLIGQEASTQDSSTQAAQLSKATSFISTTYSAASLISFLVFLVNGRYRTLLDRILRMRLRPKTSHITREVSFEYLNRQLVWHSFTEFLLFILPLIGIARWRRWLTRAWRKGKQMIFRSKLNVDADQKGLGELHFLPERTCAICYNDQHSTDISETNILQASGSGGIVGSIETDVTSPYEAIPCGCVYCFVCIAQQLEAQEGDGWTCLRCGELIKQCKPWNGDVLELEENVDSESKNVPSYSEVEDVTGDDSLTEVEPRPEEDGMSGSTTAGENDEELDDLEARHGEDADIWAKINGLGGSRNLAPFTTDLSSIPNSEDEDG